jgi:hypothetical protein
MDQHSVVVVVMISVFAINQIQIWEATVILVIHIIYQIDTRLVEMQEIFNLNNSNILLLNIGFTF